MSKKYIDADKLIELANNMGFRGNKHGEVVKAYVDACPPADVRPNVRGEWIKRDSYDRRDNFYACSECGRLINIICNAHLEDYPFCHCGADMRKVKKNEDY